MAGKKEKGGQFFLVNTDDEWLAAMEKEVMVMSTLEKEVMVTSTNHHISLGLGSGFRCS